MSESTGPAPVPILTTAGELRERPSAWRSAGRSLATAKWPILALIFLAFTIFVALFADQISPHDPNRQNLILRLQAPFTPNDAGDIDYYLGTDPLGRDIVSRLIYGARISASVGVMSVLLGGFIGTALGVIAGYYGGRLDDVIMRLADLQLAFPFILLAIMVLVVLGAGIVNLILVLAVGQWVTYARITRGSTIGEREKEYVEASRSIGAGNGWIMLRDILPNILAPLIVIASFNIASVILAEAALSFLGLGVPPTVPTWGGMLAESRDQLLGGFWWLAMFPGLSIALVVLSLNIIGDWLRDFLDPRLRNVWSLAISWK